MGYPQRSWLTLGLGIPGWVMLGLIATGAVIGAVGVMPLQQGWALSFRGVETVGRVTGLGTSEHACGRDNLDNCTDRLVTYSYDEAGQAEEAIASVSDSFYLPLHLGQSLPVRYIGADTATSEIEFDTTLIGAVFQALLALGLMLIPGGFLAWRLRAAWRMVHLRDEGQMRRAEVLTCAPNNVRVNTVRQYVINWRDETGATGESRGRRQDDLPALGDTITVFADPDGHWPAVWEGDSGSR